MKKFNLGLFLVLVSSPAFAFVTKFTVTNNSDYQVNCAFARVAVANPQAPQVTVYHWYTIANGAAYSFNGRTDGWFCESQDQTQKWASNNFLCVSRQQYVNPFFKANSVNDCNNFGGEMVGFYSVSGNGAQGTTLNAPN